MPTFSRLLMQLKDASTSANLRIAGEAADKDYRDQIQIMSIGWAMGRSTPKGVGETRGTAQPEEFTFRKEMDRASTAMLNKMRHGVRLDAVVTLDSLEDSTFKLTLRLNNVRIVDYRVDGKDGDKSGEIVEDWSFTYDEIVVDYSPKSGDNLTTRQKRTPDTSANKATMDAILDGFKALNEPKRIDVSARLKKDYPKLFSA